MRLILTAIVIFLINTNSLFAQSVTIIQPNGGEKLYACDQYTVKFTATGTSNYYNIDYSLNNGANWISSATNLLITNGQYLWNVPKASSTTCLLRIRDKSDTLKQDISDNVFSILIPVKLVSPIGGENWVGNTLHPIVWNMIGTSGTFNISYSTNNGTTWTSSLKNSTSASNFPPRNQRIFPSTSRSGKWKGK